MAGTSSSERMLIVFALTVAKSTGSVNAIWIRAGVFGSATPGPGSVWTR